MENDFGGILTSIQGTTEHSGYIGDAYVSHDVRDCTPACPLYEGGVCATKSCNERGAHVHHQDTLAGEVKDNLPRCECGATGGHVCPLSAKARERVADARRSYAIKDSGKRESFKGGMVRDTAEGKTNFALIFDGPMYDRWAEHLTKGAKKYEKRNWLKGANGSLEEVEKVFDRAIESTARHFRQWMKGDVDEDHAAAVFFGVNQVEFLKDTMKGGAK